MKLKSYTKLTLRYLCKMFGESCKIFHRIAKGSYYSENTQMGELIVLPFEKCVPS